jgi:hypothetical protein
MKTSINAPKMPYKIPPPPTLRSPSISSNTLSLGRTIAEGFAFGTGSSIARKILDKNDSSSAKPGIELEVSKKAPTLRYGGGNGNNGDNDELCKAIRNQMVSCKNRDMYDALNTFYKELCTD